MKVYVIMCIVYRPIPRFLLLPLENYDIIITARSIWPKLFDIDISSYADSRVVRVVVEEMPLLAREMVI